MNPYRIPSDGITRVINFSGGRSSAYMLRQILVAHDGELPADTFVAFANTGKEREETLVFVRECGEHWDIPITWLEYIYRSEHKGTARSPKQHYRIVDFDSASRAGEPFEAMIRRKQFLPNPVMRMCTEELKIETIRRWMWRENGIKEFRRVLGIRKDEDRRVNKALFEECRVEYPMVLAGATVEDVAAFWRQQNFDLGIESWQGNCDCCFLKGKGKLLRILRAEPERGNWWNEMERFREAVDRRTEEITKTRFRDTYSFEDLLAWAAVPGLWDDVDDDDGGVDCFCGD